MIKAIPHHVHRMVYECVALLLIITIPLSVQAGVLERLIGQNAYATTTDYEPVASDSALDTPILSAAQNADPSSARGGAEIIAVDGALVSSGPIGEDELEAARQNSGEISVYVVREGDSLSQIAEMFDVTANTILWANDLTSAKSIRPGQTLIILPVAGVRHVVKSGDTIASIAKKYSGNAEEIVKYNQLASESDLAVGMTLVVPGGALHTAPAKKPAGSKGSSGGSGLIHPVPGAIKTQGIHGYNGVDFAAGMGTAIRAAAAGEVIVSKSSGWNGGYGSYIVIRHANGMQTLYAHLSSNNVGVGATVAQGEVIGGMGNTGRSTGTHLHFEVRGGKNPF
jgi:LysM repeat protein